MDEIYNKLHTEVTLEDIFDYEIRVTQSGESNLHSEGAWQLARTLTDKSKNQLADNYNGTTEYQGKLYPNSSILNAYNDAFSMWTAWTHPDNTYMIQCLKKAEIEKSLLK